MGRQTQIIIKLATFEPLLDSTTRRRRRRRRNHTQSICLGGKVVEFDSGSPSALNTGVFGHMPRALKHLDYHCQILKFQFFSFKILFIVNFPFFINQIIYDIIFSFIKFIVN